MFKCNLCSKEFTSIRNLAIHISHKHSLSTKEYFDMFSSDVNIGKCIICGNPTNFNNLANGIPQYNSGTMYIKLRIKR